jgi:hypothetical protein
MVKVYYIKFYIVMRPACLIGLLVSLRVLWFYVHGVRFFPLTCPMPDIKIGY